MSIVDEIWKDVPDYEGYYQVSSLGRVRSCDRFVAHSGGGKRTVRQRVLNQCKDRYGYWNVCLCFNGKPKTVTVHSLVAKAFIGDRLTGDQINHIDGNKDNNSLRNLEYCSPSKNNQHAYDLGLKVAAKGENQGSSKLTQAQVLRIREAYASGGVSQAALAKLYGIGQQTVCRIIARKTWKHI